MTISLLICFLLQVLLSQVKSQAPGDADSFCTSLSGTVALPSYPPNSRILMDSYQYIHLLPTIPGSSAIWQQVDVDNRTDPSTGERTIWFQARSFACRQTLSSCYFNVGGQNNWLITQHISRVVDGNLLPQVSVQLEFQLTGCSFGCQISFLLEVWETSTIDRDAARVTSNYRRIMRVAPTTEATNISQNASIPINFESPTATGFYVAILDENTCIALTRVIVFYHVCPEMVLDLIRYPETLSPPINVPQPQQVNAQCVDNASGELQGGPQLYCIQGGKWGVVQEGTGCQCDPGFMYIEETEECIRCPVGEYVSPTNFSCQPCPRNTRIDVEGMAECECLAGYFRAADKNADFGCTPITDDVTSTEDTPSLNDKISSLEHQLKIARIVYGALSITIVLLIISLLSISIFCMITLLHKKQSKPPVIVNTEDFKVMNTTSNVAYGIAMQSNTNNEANTLTKDYEDVF